MAPLFSTGGLSLDPAGISPGVRFLAAFNDIEDHMRSSLQADQHVEFIRLARDFANRKHLTQRSVTPSVPSASLRNAISHGRYFDGRPIAEPVKEVVEQIERLRDQALTVLGLMDVRMVSMNDPIDVALGYVRQFDYSQLPVYDDGVYVALLTTNAIAIWLAAQLTATGGIAETVLVHQVIQFAEPHEKALLDPCTTTVTDAIHSLTRGGSWWQARCGLVVTETGKPTEKPMAMVVVDDLPTLSAAVELS